AQLGAQVADLAALGSELGVHVRVAQLPLGAGDGAPAEVRDGLAQVAQVVTNLLPEVVQPGDDDGERHPVVLTRHWDGWVGSRTRGRARRRPGPTRRRRRWSARRR